MKKNHFIHCMAASALVLFASCSDDQQATIEKDNPVFTTAIAPTRASNAQWDAGDAIGIYMFDQQKNIAESVKNYKYQTPTAAGAFAAASNADVIFFPQNDKKVLFKAYYPYQATAPTDLVFPLRVNDQTDLPKIDFMTAEPTTEHSKRDPNVHLRFHHRLSKLEFNLTLGEGASTLDLKDVTLTIKGMRTEGAYNLATGGDVSSKAGTENDIVVPIAAAGKTRREAIVLPRVASTGVEFEFKTKNGELYVGEMDGALQLKSGYRYIFDVLLEKNKAIFSVDIVDWVDGESRTLKLQPTIATGTPGTTDDFFKNKGIYVYQTGSKFKQAAYTYKLQSTNAYAWESTTPLCWEDLSLPTTLTGAHYPDAGRVPTSLNSGNQKFTWSVAANQSGGYANDDLLLSTPKQYPTASYVNMEFRHALSQVKIIVKDNGGFTADELKNMKIELLGLHTSGTADLTTGAVTMPSSPVTITPMKSATIGEYYALAIPTQTISQGAPFIKVAINGAEKTGMLDQSLTLQPGEMHEITITLNKEEITLSATLKDWVEGAKGSVTIN